MVPTDETATEAEASPDDALSAAPDRTSDEVKAALSEALDAGDVEALRALLPQCALGTRSFAVQRADEGSISLTEAFIKAGLPEKTHSQRLTGAASRGDLERMALYASAGGRIGTVSDPPPSMPLRWSPLHFAAQNGHVAAVNWLVEHGAFVGIRNGDGYTPLHIAVDRGHLEVVQVLVAAGASPTARADDRNTPSTLARSQTKEIRSALKKRTKKPTT